MQALIGVASGAMPSAVAADAAGFIAAGSSSCSVWLPALQGALISFSGLVFEGSSWRYVCRVLAPTCQLMVLPVPLHPAAWGPSRAGATLRQSPAPCSRCPTCTSSGGSCGAATRRTQINPFLTHGGAHRGQRWHAPRAWAYGVLPCCAAPLRWPRALHWPMAWCMWRVSACASSSSSSRCLGAMVWMVDGW